MKITEIDEKMAALIAENQALGREHDAIRDKRTELRKEIDALILERHMQIAVDGVRDVVAPGAVVEVAAASR